MALLVLLVALAGCKQLPNPFAGEKVLARAGKETLRLMDLEEVLPAGITGDDSVKWVEKYVDRWVRDNLKLREAKMIFGDDAADEELVRAYRNSLITRQLDDYYIKKVGGDSLYTIADLHEFYDANRGQFVLDRAIVKGRVVAFPTAFRQKARLRELFGSWGPGARDEVTAMAAKNDFTFVEVNDWMEYSQFLALLPTRRNESYDKELRRAGVQEMTDGKTTWWFVLAEKRTEGESAPFETVSELVRQSVTARRRAEIIKECEDSLFRIALLENNAAINN